MRASDEGVEPVIHMALYEDFPRPAARTGFTIGLSHSHPPEGSHRELVISMLDEDDAWAAACCAEPTRLEALPDRLLTLRPTCSTSSRT